MKYLLIALSIFALSCQAYATPEVWKSSNTATADTTKVLCTGTASRPGHGVISSVCVNTGAAGTFTVYNSSATSANPIAAIDTAAKGCNRYDVGISSGLTYTNSATANVTIMYQCF